MAFSDHHSYGEDHLERLIEVEDAVLEYLENFPDEQLETGKSTHEYTKHWAQQIRIRRKSRELRIQGKTQELRRYLDDQMPQEFKGTIHQTSQSGPLARLRRLFNI